MLKKYNCDAARAWLALLLSAIVHVRVVPAALHGLPNALYERIACAVHDAKCARSALLLSSSAHESGVCAWSPVNVRILVPGTLVCVLPDALWMLSVRASPLHTLLSMLNIKTTS